jgi:hypothetical protein
MILSNQFRFRRNRGLRGKMTSANLLFEDFLELIIERERIGTF